MIGSSLKTYQTATECNCYISNLASIGLNELLHDTGEIIILCLTDNNQQLL